MPNRLSDIQDKLAYLLMRHEELSKKLTEAQHSDAEIEYLGIQVGEIVGGCRECLDYCMKDIADSLMPGYLDGRNKEKIYFPFSRKAVSDGKGFFRALEQSNPNTYRSLLDLIGQIEDGAEMDGIGPFYGYGLLRDINNLVNDKKHDKITRTISVPKAKTLVEHPSGARMTFSMYDLSSGKSESMPPIPVIIQKEATQCFIKDFFVGEHEADALCGSAIKAVSTIITGFYEELLSLEDGEVNPWELRKELEVRLGDRALRTFSPILSRPIGIGLYLKEKRQIHIDYHFDGEIKNTPMHLVPAGRFLLEIYRRRFAAINEGKFRQFIKENWRSVADQTPTTKSYYELVINLPDVHEIELENGDIHKFDRIVFGIQYKFRTKSQTTQESFLSKDDGNWLTSLRNMFDASVPIRISLKGGAGRLFQIDSIKTLCAF